MTSPPSDARLAPIVDALANHGWCRRTDLIPTDLVAALAAEAEEAFAEGLFRRGRIGRGDAAELRPEVRTDRILWVDPTGGSEAVRAYLDVMEALRLVLNRELQLGLFEFEGHLAVYPPGSFYRRHLDQNHRTPLRAVSCITYLNPAWDNDDGGELRLYLPGAQPERVDVAPIGGHTLLFLSADFEHEVLPARRDRTSLTGWFRRRPS